MKTLLVLLAAFYSFAGAFAGSFCGSSSDSIAESFAVPFAWSSADSFAGTFATAAPDQADSLLVVSWNVENFLDYRSDTTGRHTRKRFYSKCNAIAKTLLLISEEKGRLPDAVALMEVGDRFVLERLVRDTPLRKLDYAIVHYDSPDRRGIDCALLYRRSTLKLLRSAPIHLYDSTGAVMSTRDILLAEFGGLDILVNHHPSKVGADSERRRAVAMARMRELMDSLAAAPSTFWAGSVDGSAESGPPSTKTASSVDEAAIIGPPSTKAASGVDEAAKIGPPSTKAASGVDESAESSQSAARPWRRSEIMGGTCTANPDSTLSPGAGERDIFRPAPSAPARAVLERSDAGGFGGYACSVREHVAPRRHSADPSGVRPLGVQGDSSGRRRPVLAVGDFNDDVWPHDGPREASEGTIKYNGAWEKIDGHFALGPLEVHESVFAHPLLTEPDRSFGGTKPRRAFSGPRWLGGVSDHYPVIFRIVIACATTFD